MKEDDGGEEDRYPSVPKQLANGQGSVWLGTSVDTVSDKPENNEKNLDKAVDKMFKKFRPKKQRELKRL